MVSNTWGLSDLKPLRLRHLRYTYILNFNQSYWVVDCCEHISTHRPRSQNLSWLSPGRVVQTVTWAVSSQQSTSGIGSDPIPNHFAHTTDERTPCWTLSWTNQRCRMIFHLQAPYFCTPFRWKMPPCLVLVDQTVDERNPVPVNMKNMPSVLGFHTYICICMNWCRVSSINHTNLFFYKNQGQLDPSQFGPPIIRDPLPLWHQLVSWYLLRPCMCMTCLSAQEYLAVYHKMLFPHLGGGAVWLVTSFRSFPNPLVEI